MEKLTKDEVLAILKANRALGPEYDEETAQQLLERLHSPSDPVAASHERRHGRLSVIPFFALSIPLLAIAGGIAHGPGVLGVLLMDSVVAVMLLGPWNR